MKKRVLTEKQKAAKRAYYAAHKTKWQAYHTAHKIERQDYNKVRGAELRRQGYDCWRSMVRRCYDSRHDSYRWYGAVGVVVCNRWRYGENGKSGFECFLEDVGPRPSPKHSISRHGDVGNYEPGNCEWAIWNYRQRIVQYQHGTTGMYYARGCRCDLCRMAARDSARRYRAKNPEPYREACRRSRAKNRIAINKRQRQLRAAKKGQK